MQQYLVCTLRSCYPFFVVRTKTTETRTAQNMRSAVAQRHLEARQPETTYDGNYPRWIGLFDDNLNGGNNAIPSTSRACVETTEYRRPTAEEKNQKSTPSICTRVHGIPAVTLYRYRSLFAFRLAYCYACVATAVQLGRKK